LRLALVINDWKFNEQCPRMCWVRARTDCTALKKKANDSMPKRQL